MKTKQDQTKTKQDQVGLNECPFMDVNVCLRQSPKTKLDLGICTNCILGRIEKHIYAIVKKLYLPSPKK
jgi:hypothetical protein